MAKIKHTHAEPELIDLKECSNSQFKKMLHLNNHFARETSGLFTTKFEKMIEQSFAAIAIAPEIAMLIAFDQDADYDNPNFKFFKSKFDDFIYIDRVIVAKAEQGKGIATALYDILFEMAQEAGQTNIVCEINTMPANEASSAFHDAMGFEQIGEAVLDNGLREVAYLHLEL